MGWTEKERHLSLEEFPIHGLFFLDSDMMIRLLFFKYGDGEIPAEKSGWLRDQKFPRIEFPSGATFDLSESSPEAEATVHLFGEMNLAYRASRDEALNKAQAIAETAGYAVKARGEQQLDVWGEEEGEQFILTYDDQARRLVNIEPLPEPVARPIDPSRVLMNEAIRQMLPPLSTVEEFGEEALAPIKYVSADGHFIWYVSAFDGTSVMYGLGVGRDIRLGYGFLSEMKSEYEGWRLPVKRDLEYVPKTLRELKLMHQRERAKGEHGMD